MVNTLKAQQVIGKILDAETNEPISLVNVFFANTLIGTTSDIDGNFILDGFGEGKYDLVVSHIGYETFSFSLEFDNNETRHIDISLTSDPVELLDVYVNADTSGWAYNYELFKANFLGQTRNAHKTKILNPKVLFLYFDQEENTLNAHAKEPLKIENYALGYNITYLLKEFQINFNSGKLRYFGIPQISLMETENKKEEKKWEKARVKAYNGSLLHFFRSLKERQLTENGFVVHKLYRVTNRNRPPSELIEKKMDNFREASRKKLEDQKSKNKEGSRDSEFVNILDLDFVDSLSYWSRMKSLPERVDSLGEQIESGIEITPYQENIVDYKGLLEIKYLNEREEVFYTRTFGRKGTSKKDQISVITFLDDRLTIYDNGYYDDLRSVFIEEYLAWSTNISELLPLEYVPPQKN